jgi:hypothetical protein
LSNNFSSLGYTAPAGITNHYVAGLKPNTSYTVTVQSNAGQSQVSVVSGPGITDDNAGLLGFDGAGKALTAPPRWLTAKWVSGALQLTGLGDPLLSYQVLVSTNLFPPNWTTAGSVTADTSGTLQFFPSTPANTPQRFFRLAR